MRPLHFLFALLLLPLLSLHAQTIPAWELVLDSSGGPGNYWAGIAAADTRHFMLAGYGHDTWTVMQSSDAGASWTPSLSTPAGDLVQVRAVAYPTPKLLVMLWDSTLNSRLSGVNVVYDYTTYVLRSSDGGASWEQVMVGEPLRDRRSAHLRMTGPTTGYLVQWGKTTESVDHLWRTVDGGASWNEVSLPPGLLGVLDMAVLGDSALILYNFSTVARTSDSGATWETFPSTLPPTPMGISFATPAVGYAAGSRSTGLGDQVAGMVYRTNDGGRTWTKLLDTMINGNGLRFVRCVDTLNAIVTGGAGVFRTRDGGASWSLEATPTNGVYKTALGTFAMPAVDTIVGYGSAFVLRSVGGTTLAATAIVKPEKDTATTAQMMLLSWLSIGGAKGYHLQVLERDTYSFPEPPPIFDTALFVDNATVSDTVWLLTNLKPGKEYIARVRGVMGASQSSWSDLRWIEVSGEVSSVEHESLSSALKRIVVQRGTQRTIPLPQGWSGTGWSLTDASGRRVAGGMLSGNTTISIDTRSLPPGLYFLRGSDRSGTALSLLVVP